MVAARIRADMRSLLIGFTRAGTDARAMVEVRRACIALRGAVVLL